MTRFLLPLLALVTLGVAINCPGGAVSNVQQNRCYWYVQKPAVFADAEQTCMSAKGHLVSIRNAYENDIIASTVRETPKMSTYDYWIGMDKVNGTWGWTDGTPFSFNSWSKGEPQASGQFNCATSNPYSHLWQPKDCNTLFPFVCVVPQVA